MQTALVVVLMPNQRLGMARHLLKLRFGLELGLQPYLRHIRLCTVLPSGISTKARIHRIEEALIIN